MKTGCPTTLRTSPVATGILLAASRCHCSDSLASHSARGLPARTHAALTPLRKRVACDSAPAFEACMHVTSTCGQWHVAGWLHLLAAITANATTAWPATLPHISLHLHEPLKQPRASRCLYADSQVLRYMGPWLNAAAFPTQHVWVLRPLARAHAPPLLSQLRLAPKKVWQQIQV